MSIEMGLARILGAEAIGQPGQRRFRLFVQNEQGSAVLWMEKEQLNSLSLALDRFLAQLTGGQLLRIEVQVGKARAVKGMPPEFLLPPLYELQVGQLRLTYDEQDETFGLSAVPLEIVLERGEEPQGILREEDALSFNFTLGQAQELSASINAVVSAGRPVCPYCGTPLDGGPHACVKQNGHREILQIEDGNEDDEEE